MIRRLPLLLLLVTSAAQAQFKSATLKELDQPSLLAVVPKVRAIRAEPNVITLKVGQSMALDAITVVVIDSAGTDRGRVRGFDFGIPPASAAQAVPRTLKGMFPGTTDLTIRFPRGAWKTRSDQRPFTIVKVVVKN